MTSPELCPRATSLRPARANQIRVAEENFKAVVGKIDTAVHRAHTTEKKNTKTPITSHQRDTKSTAEKVLISVRLHGQDSVSDIKQWEQQLAQNIPEDVADVKIQAAFNSGAAHRVVMLTMPRNVWAMLEDNEAYSFVEFVTSDIQYPGDQVTLMAPVPEGVGRWN